MSINIPKLTEDLNIIQTLEDQPALTSAQLKAKFDEASNKIKDYINNILIDNINNAIKEMEDVGNTLDTKLTEKLKAIYHVGKEITTSVAINPATYLGFGTWELTGIGKVEIGVDTNDSRFNQAGKTGGSFSKTLARNQIPTLSLDSQVITDVSVSTTNSADLSFNQGPVVTGVSATKRSVNITNNNQQSVDITPAYETVYRYRRTT